MTSPHKNRKHFKVSSQLPVERRLRFPISFYQIMEPKSRRFQNSQKVVFKGKLNKKREVVCREEIYEFLSL